MSENFSFGLLTEDTSEWLQHIESEFSSSPDDSWYAHTSADLFDPTLDNSIAGPATAEQAPSPIATHPSPTSSTPSTSTASSGQYVCSDAPCACGKFFSRQSELKKHTARITRPHPCPSCPRHFATKHDLTRHRREVHHEDENGLKAESFVCHVTLCKRNRKGFGRRENLISHIKRVHGEAALRPQQNQHQQHQSSIPNIDNAFPQVGMPMGMGLGSRELEEKLQAMMRERDSVRATMMELDHRQEELNQDIEALKRVAQLMNGTG